MSLGGGGRGAPSLCPAASSISRPGHSTYLQNPKFSLFAHPVPSTEYQKVPTMQPFALYLIKPREKEKCNFYLALWRGKCSNCRLIQFYVGEKYTQKEERHESMQM